MIELIAGSIIGAVVSTMIAELYHRRNAADMRRQVERFESLYDDLAYFTMRAADEAEQAHQKSRDAWGACVVNTPDDPDFPYK